MKNIGEKLKDLRQSRNYTMDELLNIMNSNFDLSVSRGMISRWENNKAYPATKYLIAYSDIFNVSMDYLTSNLNWEEYDENTDIDKIKLDVKICEVYGMKSGILLNNYEQLDDDGKEKLIDISFDMIKESDDIYTTVYTIEKVAAGNGYGYTNESSVPYYTDRIDLHNYDFATVVKGDSMIPKFNDGDIILVKTGYDNVNGDIYVIDYDGKSYVKKLYNDGDRFRLVSINKKYENIIIDIPTDDSVYFNIVGKVVDSFTPVG